MDDSNFAGSDTKSSANTGSSAPVAYCQECGRPLAPATVRRVGTGVFCPLCANHRQGTAPSWQSVNSGPYGGTANPIAAPHAAGDPSPAFAGMLGLIPGVGAMYNGQYAKGAMHLIVFVVLVALADNLNWVFYWLVWGWVFYQAFDAYHTARARRDGLPLPNPFGWNDLGDRLGFNRTSPPVQPQPMPGGFNSSASHGSAPGWSGYAPPKAPAQASFTSYAEPPQSASDNPYAAPYTSPAPPPVPPAAPPMMAVPYAPTYTGIYPGQTSPTVPPPAAGRRFPSGALWLIGLGILFLLGNVTPEFRLSGRWLVPVLLAVLAAWSGLRRWEQFRTASTVGQFSQSLACMMTGPSVLFTVAVLLALQAADAVPLHRSWPVLLVVWGTMLLLQRATTPGIPMLHPEPTEQVAAPIRSTSGTGSLGL